MNEWTWLISDHKCCEEKRDWDLKNKELAI